MRSSLILIFILILIISIIYINYQNNDITYIKSDIDNQYYLVRDLNDKTQGANLLAKIKQNIMILTNYLYYYKDTKYIEYRQYIIQLYERIQNVAVMETSADSIYTSYSVNKGEQLVFCLRSRQIKNKIHKFNLLMYVVLHEISHVACPEYGHTVLFKKIFAFITNVAIEIGLYQKINFPQNPTEYCGLIITDSII